MILLKYIYIFYFFLSFLNIEINYSLTPALVNDLKGVVIINQIASPTELFKPEGLIIEIGIPSTFLNFHMFILDSF